jgi:hypothetical protein
MKELAPLVKGKADMGKVNMMIKEKLSINWYLIFYFLVLTTAPVVYTTPSSNSLP